jgi:hypothetical protein
MYIQEFPPLSTIPALQTVFQNGDGGEFPNGYGIKLTYTEVGFEEFEWDLYFARLQDPRQDWIKLNASGALSVNTWYQFSVRFNTFSDKGSDTTNIIAYQNGSAQVNQDLTNPIVAPGELDAPFWLGFYGRLTDMAVINVPLTTTQLAAYGTAPYI